ncbi:hypothetical protein GTQ99_16675 [Kineococcus sp. T13]|uniref:hypothetical protein n=1 Tax=Kineococcus vitellinus TaxID=2696565 RepID=UPI00141358F7|nr:hypothetical protein [Kineococcus vitellinus]NAZ77044.1 hypothetical protein [Kineococcus vitellinus]
MPAPAEPAAAPAATDRWRALVVPVGVLCSVCHLVLAPVHGADHPITAILTLVTAVSCLFHLGRLWRLPTRRGWCSSGALALLMSLHLPLTATLSGAESGGYAPTQQLLGAGHHTGYTSAISIPSFATLTALGTIAGVTQLALCVLAIITGGATTRAAPRRPLCTPTRTATARATTPEPAPTPLASAASPASPGTPPAGRDDHVPDKERLTCTCPRTPLPSPCRRPPTPPHCAAASPPAR